MACGHSEPLSFALLPLACVTQNQTWLILFLFLFSLFLKAERITQKP